MLETQLTQLGFHKNEIKVYLALFELGQCKAGDIIEQTKLHRNLVYTALDDLEKRELISKTLKGGVAEFNANDPKHLLDEIENKKQLTQAVVKELKNKQLETPREVKVYEGIEGIRKFKEKSFHLPKDESCYIISASSLSTAPDLEAYWREYHTKRVKKGLPAKFLFDQTTDKDALLWRKNLAKTEVRSLPFGTNMPIWFEIFGDYLGIGLPGDNPLLFSIKSSEAAKGMKGFFNYFWNSNTTTLRGEDGARQFFNDTLNYSDVYFIGGNGGVEKFYPKVWDEHKYERLKHRVFWHDLITPSMTLSSVEPGKTILTEPYYEYKYLPETVANPHVICIYGNKVANIVWKEDSVINIIDDAEVAEGYKKYFDLLWNQETTLTEGFDAFANTWTDLFNQLKSGDTYRIFGAGFGSGEDQKKYANFFKDLHQKRITRGVKGQLLFHYGAEEVVHKYKMNELYVKDQEFKNLPFKSEFPVEVFFHDETTLLLIQKKEPTLIKIKNKDVAKSFKNYFDEFWNQETQVLYGAEALKNLWLEAIDCGELHWIGAQGYFMDNYPELYKEVETKAKQTKNIVWKNVVDKNFKGHQLTKLPWCETRYNLSNVRNPNVIWLYGNKVLITNWTNKEPIIFVSTNSSLIQSYNDYFDELWNLKK